MSHTLQLTEELIAQASVTPNDADCQAIIAQRLAAIGFACEHLPFGPTDGASPTCGPNGQRRARRRTVSPMLVFAGHTDVVPTGPLEQWHSAPFVPTHRDGRLFGRGASDMKASLAAFVVASEEFLAAGPTPG